MSTNPAAERIDFLQEIDFSQILASPILDIAARVWEPERYAAFQLCYRSMRILDNLVDHRKSNGTPISPQEAHQFALLIDDFVLKIKRKEADDTFTTDLLTVINRFALPLWPWERLANAMKYDLLHDRFPTFLQFLRYCEGAAISPAAVFMHLIGVSETEQGYTKPSYDIRKAARSLAIFSYLVHILRDYTKDHTQNLCYFSEDLMSKYNVTAHDLNTAAAGTEFTATFRALVAEYVRIAEYYRNQAQRDIEAITLLLTPRYRFSLELIYQLYLQIFEQVQNAEGKLHERFTALSPQAIQARIVETSQRFTTAGK